MKKFLLIFLSLISIIAFAACERGTKNSDVDNSSSETNTESSIPNTSEESGENSSNGNTSEENEDSTSSKDSVDDEKNWTGFY